MSVRFHLVLLLGALALAPACTDRRQEPPIPDDTFVEVMIALRRAALLHADDAAAFEAEKAAILARAQVTDSTLQRYVRVRAREPQQLRAVLAAIRDSLRPPLEDTGTVRPAADPGIIR
jgi:hypothetical protein